MDPMVSLAVLASGLEFGLLNALTVLGSAVAFRFAGFPDLTIEGSVLIGAAAAAVAAMAGCSPLVCVAWAAFGGCLAGALTASLVLLTRMSRLLAGILVMTAAYGVCLRLMNGSNLALYQTRTLYAAAGSRPARVAITLGVVVPLAVGLGWFLRTEFGVLLRATGENERLLRRLRRPGGLYLVVSLALANALVAVSGGLVAHYNRVADVGFGAGTIVTALAALLIGEAIVVPSSVPRQILAALVGSIGYYSAYSAALRLGLHPWDLKIASAALLLIVVSATRIWGRKHAERRIGADPL